MMHFEFVKKAIIQVITCSTLLGRHFPNICDGFGESPSRQILMTILQQPICRIDSFQMSFPYGYILFYQPLSLLFRRRMISLERCFEFHFILCTYAFHHPNASKPFLAAC